MNDKNKLVNRISKATGHLESIKKMIERGDNPYEILVQLQAVKSAVNSAGKEILKNYLAECAADGKTEDLKKVIDSFIK